jgi:LmbE family N-acetylglucosaminyl deacetylase
MQKLTFVPPGPGPLRVLALGAHADDIEIGCGGTLLRLASEHPGLEVTWVVFCSSPERDREARASAEAFLAGARHRQVVVKALRDGYLPYVAAEVKDEFEALKAKVAPDLVLTHYRDDRHQDHRLISELTWNTWRSHLILEYEIPKYDGDMGSPNLFVSLTADTLERKIALVLEHFPSQASRPWFTPDVFRSLARLRGMECPARERYAEAFYCRKMAL